MRLNDIKCTGHFAEGENLCFELDCGWDEAAALNGQALVLTEDGDTVEEHVGYRLFDIKRSADATLFCWFDRDILDTTKQAIGQLEKSVNELHGSVSEANSTAAAAEQSATQAAVDAAEAKAAAESAGTDPQIAVVARLTAASIDFGAVSATDCVAISDYIPQWEDCIGRTLKKNSPVEYEGTIYRCSQDVTVQSHFDPVTAGESQYYPVEVDEDGIIIYRTCHGEYNMVHEGEKRHYPGAGDPVYIALQDTDRSPEDYPAHWQLVEDGEGAEQAAEDGEGATDGGGEE